YRRSAASAGADDRSVHAARSAASFAGRAYHARSRDSARSRCRALLHVPERGDGCQNGDDATQAGDRPRASAAWRLRRVEEAGLSTRRSRAGDAAGAGDARDDLRRCGFGRAGKKRGDSGCDRRSNTGAGIGAWTGLVEAVVALRNVVESALVLPERGRDEAEFLSKGGEQTRVERGNG